MRRNAAFVAVLTLLAALIVVAWASADQPVVTPVNVTATNVVTDLCSFPVTVQGHVTGTITYFTDASGTRASLHGTEQDVLSANGKSLTGSPYTATAFAPVESDGSFGQITSVGVQEKVPLPGGGLFITAGMGFYNFGGLVIIPQHGATVNLAGLCAALSP